MGNSNEDYTFGLTTYLFYFIKDKDDEYLLKNFSEIEIEMLKFITSGLKNKFSMNQLMFGDIASISEDYSSMVIIESKSGNLTELEASSNIDKDKLAYKELIEIEKFLIVTGAKHLISKSMNDFEIKLEKETIDNEINFLKINKNKKPDLILKNIISKIDSLFVDVGDVEINFDTWKSVCKTHFSLIDKYLEWNESEKEIHTSINGTTAEYYHKKFNDSNDFKNNLNKMDSKGLLFNFEIFQDLNCNRLFSRFSRLTTFELEDDQLMYLTHLYIMAIESKMTEEENLEKNNEYIVEFMIENLKIFFEDEEKEKMNNKSMIEEIVNSLEGRND